MFAGFGDAVAFGNVGSHGFDLPDLLVFVEFGEDLVSFDGEDQVGEGSQSVVQLHQVALEVLADEVVGPNRGYLSGHGADLLTASFGEGERRLFVLGEVPFVEEGLSFCEVVDSAQDRFEHGDRVDPGARHMDEDAGR